MSAKATTWVNEDVRIPGDPVARVVLSQLAHVANGDGVAWPSQALLAERSEVSVRTVRTKLRTLEELGLISPGDQRFVTHIRADRRPFVWNLNLDASGANDRKRSSAREEATTGSSVPPVATLRPEAELPYDRKLASDRLKEDLRTTEDSLRSSSAQDLVAEWIDHCNGNRPPGRVVGQIAKEIGIMLGEGIPYDDVRNGLARWHSLGLHPSTLASVVHEIRTSNAGQLKPRRQVERESQIVSVLERARQRDQQLGHTQPKEIS